MEAKSLFEKVQEMLGEGASPATVPADPTVNPSLASADPMPQPATPTPERLAFDLNAGSNPHVPAIRKATYRVGETVRIKSPAFGVFTAEVLREDNGVCLWVHNPFSQRETCVPNSWLVEEAHGD